MLLKMYHLIVFNLVICFVCFILIDGKSTFDVKKGPSNRLLTSVLNNEYTEMRPISGGGSSAPHTGL